MICGCGVTSSVNAKSYPYMHPVAEIYMPIVSYHSIMCLQSYDTFAKPATKELKGSFLFTIFER